MLIISKDFELIDVEKNPISIEYFTVLTGI